MNSVKPTRAGNMMGGSAVVVCAGRARRPPGCAPGERAGVDGRGAVRAQFYVAGDGTDGDAAGGAAEEDTAGHGGGLGGPGVAGLDVAGLGAEAAMAGGGGRLQG